MAKAPYDRAEIMIDDHPLEIRVIVTDRNGLPAFELRKVTQMPHVMEQIARAVTKSHPLIIYPTVQDRMRFMASLVKKGLIYREGNEYHWIRR